MSPVFVPPIVALADRVRVLPARVKREAKRFVDEAVVEKRFVVVALVVVEFPVIIRLESMVEEAVDKNP